MMKILKFMAITFLIQSTFLSAADSLDLESTDTKNLHGKYPREEVHSLEEFRHKVSGLIYDLKNKSFCTGTLIGPRHLLTAAHCVYNFDKKAWSETFTFIPGQNSIDLASSEINNEKIEEIGIPFKKFFVMKDYIETKKAEFDFAVVELMSPIGEKIGWAGFRALTDREIGRISQKDNETSSSSLKNLAINFAGYPGDKMFGTLWKVNCPATPDGKVLTYYCDSFGGMSGAGLFLDNDPNNFIIGIHGWGGPVINGGVLINSLNFSLINQWKNFKKYSANTLIYSKKN